MDAITALQQRNSSARLSEPAPAGEDRHAIFQAALRAPDHARLRPWRFLTVEGDARLTLGEKMASAAKIDNPELDLAIYEKLKLAPLRAPLLVIVIAKISEHPKVPEVEQILSAGAVCQNLLVAASLAGFAAQWLTEWYTYDDYIQSLFNIGDHEDIAGFVYLGSANKKPDERARPDNQTRIQRWQQPG